MIDLKTLKQLVKLMSDQDLTELELADENGEKVHLRRRGGTPEVQYVTAPHAAAPQPAPIPGASNDTPAPHDPSECEPAPAADSALIASTITSPMVGTFYASPSPDAASFVSAGDRVEPDTVVCIVEAMKVFNEIKADMTGTVKRLLVESGQSVEYGQPLLEIESD